MNVPHDQELFLANLRNWARDAVLHPDNTDERIRASWYRQGALEAARALLGADHPFVAALEAIPDPMEV